VTRVVVVLGYSNGDRDALHPICAARLDRAAELTTTQDLVVLSGWSRVPTGRSEAELMAESWLGAAGQVVVDPDARSTVENAANAIPDVERAGADIVLVVTSRWHAARALAAFRWLLRGRGVRVCAAWPAHPSSLRDRARELPLWFLLPVQLWCGRPARTAGGRE
jgi:uncharacterized SAM-binding protein YcdF (DUF218 family)